MLGDLVAGDGDGDAHEKSFTDVFGSSRWGANSSRLLLLALTLA
jgi:hypothetical protein